MGISLLGTVGPQKKSDGVDASVRLGNRAEAVVQQLSGHYTEVVRRGNVYTASVGGAGVAPGTAVGTAAQFSIYNPMNSLKLLVIMRGACSYISGTLGAGTLFWTANLTPGTAAPSAGTVLTPVNALIGSANTPVAQVKQASTLAASPTVVRPMATLPAISGTSVISPVAAVLDDVDGELIVAPGTTLALEFSGAAGTVPLIALAVTWEEIDQ